MNLLGDQLRRIGDLLEATLKYYLNEPYNYSDEVVEEGIDILDRLHVLQDKLEDAGYKGCFRYTKDDDAWR